MNRQRRHRRVSKKRGNGEGSITKRKDGRWMARYTVHTAKGPKRKHMYGRTRQEVAEKLSKAVSDRVGGLVFDGDHETLEAYLWRWIYEVLRGTVKQSTFENYTYIARLHIIPELGRVRLRALKSRDVRRHYREKLDAGLSPRTVQIIHTVLRKALQQAVRDDVLPRNICDAVTDIARKDVVAHGLLQGLTQNRVDDLHGTGRKPCVQLLSVVPAYIAGLQSPQPHAS